MVSMINNIKSYYITCFSLNTTYYEVGLYMYEPVKMCWYRVIIQDHTNANIFFKGITDSPLPNSTYILTSFLVL